MSYAELDRHSRDFAAFLQSLPGMNKGERVAIMSPNLLQYPVALIGILRAGMTVVNVNPLYTPRELEHQLKDSGAKAIVIVENFANTLQQVIAKTQVEHVVTTQLGDLLPLPKRWIVNFVVKKVKKMVPDWRIDGAITLRAALARGAGAQFKPVSLTHEDIAFLQYTGGTTGVSKGAMLTHRNILANIEQAGAWIGGNLKEGEEIVISPLPMYHIFCLTTTLYFMNLGVVNVLITNPRDLPAFVKELKKWKWSVLTGVNTLFNGLLNTPGFGELDFLGTEGRGRRRRGGAESRWRKNGSRSPATTSPRPTASPRPLPPPASIRWARPGTAPSACPSPRPSFRSATTISTSCRSGPASGDIEKSTGEICIRGPQVMKGYWQQPEETAKVLQDGWLKTGDVGHINAKGYVTITDRKKDMILVSGFNVYPNEIESVVAMHPGVLECAAVGVPDDKSGEAVKVVIVKKDPNLTKESVIEHCKRELTGYKIPKYVEFRDSLPKTPIGKILRRELRGK